MLTGKCLAFAAHRSRRRGFPIFDGGAEFIHRINPAASNQVGKRKPLFPRMFCQCQGFPWGGSCGCKIREGRVENPQAILKPKRDACRRAKLRCSTSKGDLVSSDPMTVARTFFSTSQHCEKAMKSPKATPSVLKRALI